MIIVIVIILLLLLYFTIKPLQENFLSVGLYPSRLFGSPKHIRLDKYSKIQSLHLEPVTPKTGESRCDDVLCPPYYSDFATCYKCI